MRIKPTDVVALLLPPALTRSAGWLWRLACDQVSRLRIKRHDKLHLACGHNRLPGWANADLEGPVSVIKLDLTRPLPVASDSMTCIYSEHFIEHIEHAAAARLLRECHRALRPDGVLRISTPNLAKLVAEYQAGRIDGWADMNWRPGSPARLLNEGLRLWGHQFVFDANELESILRAAGFRQVESRGWRQSPHDALAGLECRPFKGELIYECTK